MQGPLILHPKLKPRTKYDDKMAVVLLRSEAVLILVFDEILRDINHVFDYPRRLCLYSYDIKICVVRDG